MNAIYITGLGAVCCLGTGTDRLWRGMLAAHSGPARPRDPHAHVSAPLLYAVPDDQCAADPSPGAASRFAIEAARQAVADAGLDTARLASMAVVVGTGMGDAGRHESWRLAGFPPADEWRPGFAVGSALGAFLGTTGPNTSVSNACAASGCAISMAADLIRLGTADAVLVVGAEAYSRVALGCFDRMGALDTRHCRPFAADRRGTVFGEGAAALILESAAHAANRSAARPYARVAGAGWSCDAYHLTAPEPSGTQIVRAMTEALDEAGVTAGELGCVLPHGTGTDLNDRVESGAIGRVLADRTGQVPLYSLKALIGHTGGAAGAMAAVAAALIIRSGTVPGNVELDAQDPSCQVWLPPAATPLAGRYAMINAYAFGGSNISLVLAPAA